MIIGLNAPLSIIYVKGCVKNPSPALLVAVIEELLEPWNSAAKKLYKLRRSKNNQRRLGEI